MKCNDYIVPQCEQLGLLREELICSSPEPGENEYVGYEDWEV